MAVVVAPLNVLSAVFSVSIALAAPLAVESILVLLNEMFIELPAPASAPEPVKLKSVTELCGAGGLITRGFCEHRECAKAEHAGDAVCTRLKEAEEARRFRQ